MIEFALSPPFFPSLIMGFIQMVSNFHSVTALRCLSAISIPSRCQPTFVGCGDVRVLGQAHGPQLSRAVDFGCLSPLPSLTPVLLLSLRCLLSGNLHRWHGIVLQCHTYLSRSSNFNPGTRKSSAAIDAFSHYP